MGALCPLMLAVDPMTVCMLIVAVTVLLKVMGSASLGILILVFSDSLHVSASAYQQCQYMVSSYCTMHVVIMASTGHSSRAEGALRPLQYSKGPRAPIT